MDNEKRKAVIEAYLKRDVFTLVFLMFSSTLTPNQCKIIESILYDDKEYRRVLINCMTRYGKTYCVAIGICLFIFFNKNKKIALIGPKSEQAQILRNYIIELIFKSPELLELAQFDAKGKDRIRKEASKKRQTFLNGCEYRVFSAHQEANRLMGFGAHFVIVDEACLIGNDAWEKIFRMLGDNPESGKIVALANPWSRDNKYYELWTNPLYKHIHVDWQIALIEGRTTKEWIEEMQKELTPIAFSVLYNSDFPELP